MSLNSQEINLIIAGLDAEEAQIQKIMQPDFSTLIMTLYKPSGRFNLLVCLSQGKTRLHATSREFPKAEKQQRFVQFLKSRITGGRIKSVSQPGNDRIVRIDIASGDEETILWIRLWSGNANIIATDSSLSILDLYYRRPLRSEVSGSTLVLPENVLDPFAASAAGGKYIIREFPGNSGDGHAFNSYIDSYYSSLENDEKTRILREKAVNRINRKLSLLRGALARVSGESGKAGNFEKLMQYGKLILGGSHLIKQGDEWFRTENYFDDGSTVSIQLDSKLSPGDNAASYFRQYKKAMASLVNLTDEKKNIEKQITDLEKSLADIEQAVSLAEIEKLVKRPELKKEGRKDETIPGLQFTSGSYRILLGRTAAENDELLRRHVRGNDYWLHARDYPGGYVFIKYINGKSVPLEILLDAGNLAVYFSKGRSSGKGEVYYTQVKYLRRAKNAKTGTVIPTQEKNLSITLNDNILKKLLGKGEDSLLF